MKITNEKKGAKNCSLLYWIQPDATCDDGFDPGPTGGGQKQWNLNGHCGFDYNITSLLTCDFEDCSIVM